MLLQWGRALMSADGTQAHAIPSGNCPLQWGRALMSADGAGANPRSRIAAAASMGPRSDERGWARAVASHGQQWRLLQWGRALMSADGILLCRWCRLLVALQWGRALMSADGTSGR